MALWLKWWSLVRLLRPAFSRERTFLWFAAALAATTIRADQAGVTSFVRALALTPDLYGQLLATFHSPAIKADKLAALWTAIVLKSFPGVVRVKGRAVLVGDGIKIGKEGRKMPGVKSLHQESASNTKPSYIMGHSCQALAALTSVGGYFFAVPLISRIHEGLVFSNRDTRTLMDKMLLMLQYREAVIRKMRAYHAHIQLGVIAQGMMQYLSMLAKEEVWGSFGSWLRTIRPDVLPTEQVVQTAMRNSFQEFIAVSRRDNILAKFIDERSTQTAYAPKKRASSE